MSDKLCHCGGWYVDDSSPSAECALCLNCWRSECLEEDS